MSKEDGKVIPVRVALRCRPLVPKEINEGCQCCLTFVPGEPQVIVGTEKAFTYDYVFDPCVEQEEVFNTAVFPLLSGLFKGYNATVLAYGQTGSGKTYSMGGTYTSAQGNNPSVGVIPRVVKQIFTEKERNHDLEFHLFVSYLEIYNEEILDLLSSQKDKPGLNIREDPKGGIKIVGLIEKEVFSDREMVNCLEFGNAGRTVGSTAMNAASSRSHAIFTITLEQRRGPDKVDAVVSKLHLVDLAGSERQKKTKAEGDRLKEGISINRGLLCLGNVISALGDDGKKNIFVPYRDSKLTRLLQDSLGGNSHTLMVACVSPADSNMEETINTLRYADRARKIKNKPIVNIDPRAAEISRLKKQVQELQVMLLHARGGVAPVLSCAEPAENLTKLLDRNRALQTENEKLCRELSEAAGRTAVMFEKIITTEQTNEKLQSKLDQLVHHGACSVNIEKLLETLEDQDLKETVETIKNLQELILELQNQSADTTAAINVVDGGDDVPEVLGTSVDNRADVSAQDTSLGKDPSESFSTNHALRQAQLTKELMELNKVLSLKEAFVKKMCETDSHLEMFQGDHQKNAAQEFQSAIDLLQKEKDELLVALQSAQKGSNQAKLSEQRRKRLQELEAQLSEMKKKLLEQSKLLKLKETSVQKVSKLMQEIQLMKSQRTQLMKQMREDSEKFRQWKSKKDREVLQLKEKDRKRQYEVLKLERDFQKQANVLRRKTEEAAAANKRLKDALQKRNEAAERRREINVRGMEGVSARLKAIILNEVEIIVSTEEARRHLSDLLEDRKALAQEINRIKEQLESGERTLPKIRRRTLIISELETQGSLETPLTKQLENLQSEMELRNAQIADLQQKVLVADSEGRLKQRLDAISNFSEAKGTLRLIITELISTKTTNAKLESELQQEKGNHQDLKKTLSDERNVMSSMDMEHQQQMVELEQRHQEKVLYLLNELKNRPLIEEIAEPVAKEKEDLFRCLKLKDEKLEKLNARCQELLQQNQYLKWQKTPPFSCEKKDVSTSCDPVEFNKHPNVARRITTTARRPSVPILLDMSSSDNLTEEDDEWLPMNKRRTSKKAKVFGCTCKGRCNNKNCKCRKLKIICGDNCNCDQNKCSNLGNPSPAENTSNLDVVQESQSSQDITSQSPEKNTFFSLPTCTPTTKLLKEIAELGHCSAERMHLQAHEDEEQKPNEEDDEKLRTLSFLQKKKHYLTLSTEKTFFPGCVTINEETK